jgi:hypothetical protein
MSQRESAVNCWSLHESQVPLFNSSAPLYSKRDKPLPGSSHLCKSDNVAGLPVTEMLGGVGNRHEPNLLVSFARSQPFDLECQWSVHYAATSTLLTTEMAANLSD